jgi:hypothetical protein
MALDIAKFQVDFAGGDANSSLIKFYNADSTGTQLSIKHSSLMTTIQAMVDAVNKVCSPLHGGKMPLDYQAVTATTWENLQRIGHYFQQPPSEREKLQYPDQDVICLMAFSWGHTMWPDNSREVCQTHLDKAHREGVAGEYLLAVNKLAMELQNHNLWLNKQDADWRRPLQVTIRAFCQKNFKFQGQLNEKQRQNYERFAATKRSTTNTGEDWSKGRRERSRVPWATKEQDLWADYERTGWKQEWRNTASYSQSSSSSATGSGWRPSLEAQPWRKKDEAEEEESQDITWSTPRHKF